MIDVIERLTTVLGRDLTEQQKEAILHKDGVCQLIACPGAGKSFAISARTANLALYHGIHPEKILSLTYTKDMANDLFNKTFSLFTDICQFTETKFIKSILQKNIITLHSFCYNVIKEFYRIKEMPFPNVIDGNENTAKDINTQNKTKNISKKYLLTIAYNMINHVMPNEYIIEDLINTISLAKNTMLLNNDEIFKNSSIRNIDQIFDYYEQYKKTNNLIDFEDMLLICYQIFVYNTQFLDKYRSKYEYIQIDEAQDNNRIQNNIIRLLAGTHNNIFWVGDGNQSIFAFRGANIKEFLGFADTYPDTKVINLDRNFRSAGYIVKLSNLFIKANNERTDIDMFTTNSDGIPVDIKKMDHEVDQCEYIANYLMNEKYIFNTAILSRNTLSLIAIADTLYYYDIPFYIKDFRSNFFSHWIKKDIDAFIRFSFDNTHIESFITVMNVFDITIPKELEQYLKSDSNKDKSVYELISGYKFLDVGTLKAMLEKQLLIKPIREKNPAAAICYIESKLGYKDYIIKKIKNSMHLLEHCNFILSNLKLIAYHSCGHRDFLLRLSRLRNTMYIASKPREDNNAVTLTTMHSSKGLEFDKVFIVDLVQSQIPGLKAFELYKMGEIGLIEEERRLLYVAMTRARKNLTIIFLKLRNGEEQMTSCFLDEINEILNNHSLGIRNWRPEKGTKVKHTKFGFGIIEQINGEHALVNFFSHGTIRINLPGTIERKLLSIC